MTPDPKLAALQTWIEFEIIRLQFELSFERDECIAEFIRGKLTGLREILDKLISA